MTNKARKSCRTARRHQWHVSHKEGAYILFLRANPFGYSFWIGVHQRTGRVKRMTQV